MRVGLQINVFKWPGGDAAIGPTFGDIVRRAEDAGFYSVWVMDHMYQIGSLGPPEDPMLEAYSALSYAAGITSQVKLGAMITGVTYRYPGILIKQVTTLDVLSGGRAYFGIGAAWAEREHVDLGAPFPPTAERFELLEETLQLAHQMWSGEVKPFNSKHFQLPAPICEPMPLSKPHPPIMVGGGGETKTLRFVAKYADACNLFPSPELPHKLDVLKQHCANEGRPYEEIEKTVLMNLNMEPSENGGKDVVEKTLLRLQGFADLGIDQVIIALPNAADPHAFDLFKNGAVAAAAALTTAGR
jgi:F420-dependent oxidoreductase-like protein